MPEHTLTIKNVILGASVSFDYFNLGLTIERSMYALYLGHLTLSLMRMPKFE